MEQCGHVAEAVLYPSVEHTGVPCLVEFGAAEGGGCDGAGGPYLTTEGGQASGGGACVGLDGGVDLDDGVD